MKIASEEDDKTLGGGITVHRSVFRALFLCLTTRMSHRPKVDMGTSLGQSFPGYVGKPGEFKTLTF